MNNTINDGEHSELINNIDEMTFSILEHLQKIDLGEEEFNYIEGLIEKRFNLLQKLLGPAANNPEIHDYLTGIVNSDQDTMTLIQDQKEKIGRSLMNINNLKDYIDSGST